MQRRTRKSSPKRSHRFGGDWTTQKLDVLSRYLVAYTTALKNSPSPEHPFSKWYIDAFAGTGYRTLRTASKSDDIGLLFPDIAAPEPQELLDGSARLALKCKPPFERYVFIERDMDRCAGLRELTSEFPDVADRVDVRQGDANTEIQALCTRDWRADRAVLFVDPYGMQVEWRTIEAIANTRAIDMWLLFPLGIGVGRLLKRDGDVPPEWRHRLDTILPQCNWYDAFYRVDRVPTLFGGDEEHVERASVESIGKFFNERLKDIFPGVAEAPAVLRNSKNCPLYLLCFAASNERGAPIALKIANHILKGLH